jgi:thioredoxin reductase (NADPH)
MDVGIVGAGPAGMSSAIYLHRAGFSTVVLDEGVPGGLLRNANLVENYPGFPNGISGPDLVSRFTEQLRALGVEVIEDKVRSVESARGLFRIRAVESDWTSRVAIVATGTSPDVPKIRGLGSVIGRKAFFDIVSMPLKKDKAEHVAIVGGGDAAFDYSLNLVGRGKDVTLLTRSEPRCLPLLRDRALRAGVDVRVGVRVESVKEVSRGLQIRCREGDRLSDLKSDKVLVACGRKSNIGVLSPALRQKAMKGLRIPETGIPGLYLAGDIVRDRNRQTGIAVGDGTLAAMLAQAYLGG